MKLIQKVASDVEIEPEIDLTNGITISTAGTRKLRLKKNILTAEK